MFLIRMAWKNIWRNRNRTMITMASIYFAVILSVLADSLQDGVFDNLIKNMVSYYTGYVQVHKTGYWDEQVLDNSFESSIRTEAKIISLNETGGLTGRLESFVLASSNDQTKGSLLVGIDPENESKVTNLKTKLHEGDFIKADDQSVLLSEGLAERLNLRLTDTIVLLGQGYHGATAAGKYPVKGILKFGTPAMNDRTVFMPLKASQDLFQAYGMITSYILLVNDTEQLNTISAAVKKSLGSNYEVMTWEEMLPDIKQHIESDSRNMKFIQGILYLLICFGIFGTLLMMLEERKIEMGMLVAIGMKKMQLAILLLLESLFTLLSGCIFGLLTSIPLVYYLKLNPIKLSGDAAEAYQRFGFEPVFPTSSDPEIFLNQALVVLVIGLVLSLYPVYKVIRLDPIKSMKR
ncbi:FtsX-like permease family protein [Daejeonella sp. H1SJ63]|uniref:ABC transporter permease n=1 Tax=Daejeonella sp. H1SJ63 TaxID=3034145 RepID=UPI0023EB0E5A|nr:FtsX-like permease family protein [Daejeonella sp. H1SJ63]